MAASRADRPGRLDADAPGPSTVPAGLRYAGRRLPALRAERARPARRCGCRRRDAALGHAGHRPDAGRDVRRGPGQPVPDPAGRAGGALRAADLLPRVRRRRDARRLRRRRHGARGRAARHGDRRQHPLRRPGPRRARPGALGEPDPGRDAAAADRGAWQPFADAVATQTAAAPPGRCCCSTTAARRARAAGRDRVGIADRDRRLIAADGGDLQRAVARMHAANPAAMPLAERASGRRRPCARCGRPAGADVQLAGSRTRARGGGVIEVTPDAAPRHVHRPRDWFAPQFARARLSRSPATRAATADAVRQRPGVLRRPLPPLQEAARAGRRRRPAPRRRLADVPRDRAHACGAEASRPSCR